MTKVCLLMLHLILSVGSKRGHDTIPVYQGDVALHRIGIVCISEARDATLVAYHLRKTAMSGDRRGKREGQIRFSCLAPHIKFDTWPVTCGRWHSAAQAENIKS